MRACVCEREAAYLIPCFCNYRGNEIKKRGQTPNQYLVEVDELWVLKVFLLLEYFLLALLLCLLHVLFF